MSIINAILQNVGESTLTLNIDGEVREIRNQLDELKALLRDRQVQTIQYAEKIYNIENIDEANFGFVTGKKAFNQVLTRRLIETISEVCIPAQRFLQKAREINEWEVQQRVSDKAKEIIAYSFVGVVGKQLGKLMAIGKEKFSDEKQRKYIEKCLHTVKRSLDLVNFAMLSALWDARKTGLGSLDESDQNIIARRLDAAFEPSVIEHFALLQTLHAIFANPVNGVAFPMEELATESFRTSIAEGGAFAPILKDLQALNQKLDNGEYDLIDCFEAEKLLAAFFQSFYFLVNYRMASIKRVTFQYKRHGKPQFMHRYAALGIDNKANVDAEKINLTDQAVHTEAVLLYRGTAYHTNINLYPFVIDYNALTNEHGAKICFYSSKSIDNHRLEYVFLEDNTPQMLDPDRPDIPPAGADLNEWLLNLENQKLLNLQHTALQFKEARQILIDQFVQFDD